MYTLIITGFVNLPKLAAALVPILGGTLPERKAALMGASLPIRVKSFGSADEAEAALKAVLKAAPKTEGIVRDETPQAPAQVDAEIAPTAMVVYQVPADRAPEAPAEDVLPDPTPAQRIAGFLLRAKLAESLEELANVDDPALLDEVVTLLEADGAEAAVVELVRDRIRVLRRPAPGEPLAEEVLRVGTKRLEVELTPEERAAAASAVVEGTVAILKLQADAKEAADVFKARIKLAESERATQISRHTTGKEQREVDVRWVFVPTLDRVRMVRADTGAVVEERAPTDDERQRPLFGDGFGDERGAH